MNREIYKRAIEKWGERFQLEMAQEETTELSLAIRKFYRNQSNKTFEDMANEMADVEIMTEQIKLMYPDIELKIKEYKRYKLERLLNRIETK